MRGAYIMVTRIRMTRQAGEHSVANQANRTGWRWTLPRILTALAIFWAVAPAAQAQVRLNRISDTLIEITGGTGAQAWKMRYGTRLDYFRQPQRDLPADISREPQLVEAKGNRAWFSHGRWLRLIDTRKGVVVGRWYFPSLIVGLEPRDAQVQVKLEAHEGGQLFYYDVLTFDPATPKIPSWPHSYLLLNRVPEWEVAQARATPMLSSQSQAYLMFPAAAISLGTTSSSETQKLIPEFEEAVRRDPLSPWFQVSLGTLYRRVGDPRSKALFQQAVRSGSTHFSELFRISVALDLLGEREAAREAFERGYEYFWRQGNDPRLLTALINRLVFYMPPWARGQSQSVPREFRQEVMERLYRLSPYAEGADLSWEMYAAYLEKNESSDEAKLWQARAEDTRVNGLYVPSYREMISVDRAMLALVGCMLALLIYFLVLQERYRPQARLDRSARDQEWAREPFSLRGYLRYFGRKERVVYWSRLERVAFFSLILAGWLAMGLVGDFWQGFLRVAGSQLTPWSGSFAGPATLIYFQQHLPPTPERDLLVAMAHQQRGEAAQAERLYRTLPNFAEAWNNLGVLLQESGREAEARQAFERALQLDPGVAEAELNLGRPPRTLWTEQHQKIFPGKPMLVPPKRERVYRAYFVTPPERKFLRALLGPFNGLYDLKLVAQFAHGIGVALFSARYLLTPVFMAYLLTFALILAIALLLVIPSREVTQGPPRRHLVWEIFFPGTSPAWHFLGGMALLSWMYLLLQTGAYLWSGSAYAFTLWAHPDPWGPSYRIPVDSVETLRAINPSWLWFYLAPAVLFVVNLALVLWQRRRESSVSVG